MDKKPLLIFPFPTTIDRTKGKGRKLPKLHLPSPGQQLNRFSSKISNLERVFLNKSAALSQRIEGLIPEMILVLEVAGRIENFFNAVRKTPGMEFLLEYEEEPTEPDDMFFWEYAEGERAEGQIEKRIFLSMTNQQALRELKGYWDLYLREGEFKHGTGKFRTLFEQLKNIRFYSIEDRLKDTGFEEYLEEVRQLGEDVIYFEIELAYRDDAKKNHHSFRSIEVLLSDTGGQVIQESRTLIPEINYHACIARAPISVFDDLTENTDVEFLKAGQILFFRPVGQSVNKVSIDEDETDFSGHQQEKQKELNPPSIGLLDGYPLSNHNKLSGKLIIDDPDNFGENYLARGRLHGTSMASLIVNGDLDDMNSTSNNRALYVRPIMKARVFGNAIYEELPQDKLLIDLVHRAVIRIKEGEGNEPAVAPEVKIINFSIGDVYRPFHFNISTWAKLFDWLAYKYGLLFIVSAGNCSDDLQLDVPASEFETLSSGERQELVLKALMRDNYRRKILSPGEAINVLTVGSAHTDMSPGNQYPQNRLDLIEDQDLLDVVSRIGFGYSGAIKPDILMPGGRKLFRKSLNQPDQEKTWLKIEGFPISEFPPGNKVAIPGKGRSLNDWGYTCGTSNATALASRLGGQIIEILEKINQESSMGQEIPETHFAVLTKALIVHGAGWGNAQTIFDSILRQRNDVSPNNRKKNMTPYLGYGRVNGEKVLYCTDQCVTLLGYGEISKDNAHEFRFPLPASLAGQLVQKKLIITLAWFSPVNFNTNRYRKVLLYFDNLQTSQKELDLKREEYDFDISRRGTVQHDCLIGSKADAYIEEAELIVKVNCKQDASGLSKNEKIKYGLAVTLELEENVGIAIYEEIRSRIQQRVRIQKE